MKPVGLPNAVPAAPGAAKAGAHAALATKLQEAGARALAFAKALGEKVAFRFSEAALDFQFVLERERKPKAAPPSPMAVKKVKLAGFLIGRAQSKSLYEGRNEIGSGSLLLIEGENGTLIDEKTSSSRRLASNEWIVQGERRFCLKLLPEMYRREVTIPVEGHS